LDRARGKLSQPFVNVRVGNEVNSSVANWSGNLHTSAKQFSREMMSANQFNDLSVHAFMPPMVVLGRNSLSSDIGGQTGKAFLVSLAHFPMLRSRMDTVKHA
jgi:hypothetical protein